MFKRNALKTIAACAVLVCGYSGSAYAQFTERTIKFTNGITEDHPVGAGVRKMQEVLTAKSGGKMKIVAFWGGAAGGDLQA
ncbi:MAG: putative periplasmic component, partial [Pseudomonadota bacterium]